VSDYCEWCGDEINEAGKHVSVKECVPLCDKCGGIRGSDERWVRTEEHRCDCP
jgi:ribosome-binding protein aMBF1 (putative translation factor)